MFNWVKDDLKNFGKFVESNYEIKQLCSKSIDLAFIGSGLSSSSTLIEYINQIESYEYRKDKDESINIVVFEKDSWMWGGIPYGRRSGYTTLIITPLDEFLPASELSLFIDWMADNIDWLIIPFNENAGNRSKKWLLDSIDKIKSKDSARIHIPRYFFGIYIWEKIKNAINKSSKKIKLEFIKSEVTSINQCLDNKNQYKIGLENNKYIFYTNQVLLGIGIPKIRSLNHQKLELNNSLLINDPYEPDLQSNVIEIKNQLDKNPCSKILIVGANASALELIYQITNLDSFENNRVKLSILSPQGKLPDLFIKDKKTSFCAESLKELSSSSREMTADLILDAFRDDLNYADLNNYNISDTLPVFTGYVGTLVQKLSKKEKYKFISFHGLEIGRLQRRAGNEYTQPVKDLFLKDRIEIIKGKFDSFKNNKDSSMVIYQKNGNNNFDENHFDIIINCSGSSGLSNEEIAPLLHQLIESGLCKPTPSGHGIIVGNKYEVLPGFYINGPLLAGNVINDMGIWHVEHCGRIMAFANKIAHHIIQDKKTRLDTNQ